MDIKFPFTNHFAFIHRTFKRIIYLLFGLIFLFPQISLSVIASNEKYMAAKVELSASRIYESMVSTQASRVVFYPDKPIPGQSLVVIYNKEKGGLQTEGSITLFYGFSASNNFVEHYHKIKLVKTDDLLKATISLPKNAAYFWCFISDTNGKKDDNDGLWWDTYLYDNFGTPVQYARMEQALMYSQMRTDRHIYMPKILELLESELHLFPNNGRGWGEYWSIRYEMDKESSQSREVLSKEIDQLISKYPDEPWAYQAAIIGFNRIRMNKESVQMVNKFVERYPTNTFWDSLIWSILINFGSLGDWESLKNYSPRWVDKPEYWKGLIVLYEKNKISPNKIFEAGMKLLSLIPPRKDTGGNIRYDLAETWLNCGVAPKKVERVAREAVAISELGERPGILSSSSAIKKLTDRSLIINVNRSTLGWSLYQQGQYQKALNELTRAVRIREQHWITARALYFRLGKVLEKLGQKKRAIDAYLKEIAWGNYENPSRKALSALYYDLYHKQDGIDVFIDEKVNLLLLKDSYRYADSVLETNEELGRFDLNDISGQPINISAYKGKIVIIDFWATWCGPCVMTLKHTKKMQDKYKEKIVVVAVSEDSIEEQNTALEFLRKRGYDFNLVFDDEGKRRVKIPWIPSRLLIDQDGQVRLREYGWKKASEFLFEKVLDKLLNN